MNHKRFEVAIPEYDIKEVVEAKSTIDDSEDVFRDFCEEHDSICDYPFAHNGTTIGFIRALPDGQWKEVELTVESVPSYSASITTRQKAKDMPHIYPGRCDVCLEPFGHFGRKCGGPRTIPYPSTEEPETSIAEDERRGRLTNTT